MIEISKIVTEARVERSDSYHATSNIEVVIIVVLGLVSLIFFFIILSLLRSVRKLRTTISSLRDDVVIGTFISFK